MYIHIDCETIPSQRNDVRDRIGRGVTAPAQYKKAESIAKWLEDNRESATDTEWRKTALSGDYGELVCICWAVDDDPIETSSRATIAESEADLLARFFASVKATIDAHPTSRPTFVGHNVGFDLRFLHHRAVVNRVWPPFHIPYNDAVWKGSYVDTMYEWAGARDRVKLTVLCDILGIEVGDEIDGSQVWDAFRDGRIDQIEEHCQADVDRVRQIGRRLRWVR